MILLKMDQLFLAGRQGKTEGDDPILQVASRYCIPMQHIEKMAHFIQEQRVTLEPLRRGVALPGTSLAVSAYLGEVDNSVRIIPADGAERADNLQGMGG